MHIFIRIKVVCKTELTIISKHTQVVSPSVYFVLTQLSFIDFYTFIASKLDYSVFFQAIFFLPFFINMVIESSA